MQNIMTELRGLFCFDFILPLFYCPFLVERANYLIFISVCKLFFSQKRDFGKVKEAGFS